MCERYLRIETARLGERLEVNWQAIELDDKVLIPSLLLQPLLKNAILHGIQQLPEGGIVTISVNIGDE